MALYLKKEGSYGKFHRKVTPTEILSKGSGVGGTYYTFYFVEDWSNLIGFLRVLKPRMGHIEQLFIS